MQYSKDYLITIKKRLEFIFGQQHNCTGQNSTQENKTDQYYDSRHLLWKIAIKQPLYRTIPNDKQLNVDDQSTVKTIVFF